MVPLLGLAMVSRPEGDVFVLGGHSTQQWAFYGVLLLGAAAGFVTVVLLNGPNRVAASSPRVTDPRGR